MLTPGHIKPNKTGKIASKHLSVFKRGPFHAIEGTTAQLKVTQNDETVFFLCYFFKQDLGKPFSFLNYKFKIK